MKKDGVGKIEQGEIVVVEENLSVLLTDDDMLRSILALAQAGKRSPLKN